MRTPDNLTRRLFSHRFLSPDQVCAFGVGAVTLRVIRVPTFLSSIDALELQQQEAYLESPGATATTFKHSKGMRDTYIT